jgi:hypothetical protein
VHPAELSAHDFARGVMRRALACQPNRQIAETIIAE